MNQYIATFFSHFGAMRYKKLCQQQGMEAKIMPVPRNLSSSCGTCVSFRGQTPLVEEKFQDELEQIVRVTETGYEQVYSSEGD